MRVFYHTIGSDPSKDVEVFGKGYGPDKWVSGSVSEDGKYLLFGVQHGWARSEVYVQKLPDGPIQTIVNDVNAQFNLELIGEPVTDYERQALECERTGKNLSLTAEEIAASHQREWEEWISDWDDILSTYEKLLKKE